MNHQTLTTKLSAILLVFLLIASLSLTASAEIWPDLTAPTLGDLETMARSHDIKTHSNTGVKLVLPTAKEMLDEPFRVYTDNGKNHGNIYIMPIPEGGHGYLGTVATGTEVWIVAETEYYYFFVTDDGALGWNGKSYFRLSDDHFRSAQGKVTEAKDRIIDVIVEEEYTAGLRADGSVFFTGRDRYDQGWERAREWTDIERLEIRGKWIFGWRNDGTIVTTGDFDLHSWVGVADIVYCWESDFIAGLRADGTVSIAFEKEAEIDREYLEVTNWRNIKQLVYDSYTGQLVGLRTDGTVVATGISSFWEEKWMESRDNPIIELVYAYACLIGIKADGTVVGLDANEFYNIESVIAYSDGYVYAYGIRKDGTVAIMHPYYIDYKPEMSALREIKGWHDIKKLTYYYEGFPVGLREDGTVAVVHTCWSEEGGEFGEWDVSSWSGVKDIYCGADCLIGLKADGSLLVTGGQFGTREYLSELESWKDISDIYISDDHIVGLKRDGALCAAGDNTYGQCNMTSVNGR